MSWDQTITTSTTHTISPLNLLLLRLLSHSACPLGPLGTLPHSGRLLGLKLSWVPDTGLLNECMDGPGAHQIWWSSIFFWTVLSYTRLPGKQSLKWRFTCKKSIKGAFGINKCEWGLGKRVKEVGLGRERSWTGLTFQQNSFSSTWSSGAAMNWFVLSWDQRNGFLHSHTHIWMPVALRKHEGGMTLSEIAVLAEGKSQREI